MKPVTIDIYLDGALYGMRSWHHVPRVGDIVALRSGALYAEVKRVLWFELTGPDAMVYDCRVALDCVTSAGKG